MAWFGSLEIRQESDGSNVLTGSFPYLQPTTLAGGRRERFAKRSLQVDPEANIMLLRGHDFEAPLASTRAGSLTFEQDEAELCFMARLRDPETQPEYMIETLKMVKHGLLSGLSPGFNVIQEREVHGIREIREAQLVELSLVVRPAYDGASVSLRSKGQPYKPISASHLYGSGSWP